MAEPSRGGGIGRASTLIASGTLVSRGLGFVNATVLVWTIGAQNTGANAFALANGLPSNLYALIAGGLTSAVLVPQIVRAAGHDDGGQAYVNKIVTLGVTIFLGIGALATLAAPVLVPLYTIDGEGRVFGADGLALAIAFAYWCLPQVFFYAVYALLGEVLNARKVFGPFTWAPAVNNVFMIAVLLLFGALYGTDPAHIDPASWTPQQIALLGGGATLGIALQAVTLLFFWRRTGLRFRPDFRWRGVGLRATGQAAGWTFGMVLITQIVILVHTNVASLAGPGDPALAVLNIAWLVFILPHSILAMSIAIPYFTRMSGHARDGDLDGLRADLSSSLRVILLLVTGAGAGITAAALPIGAFFANEPAAAVGIATVLLGYLVGLVPLSAMYVLQRGFFALADTRTPFFIQIVQGATVIGSLVLVAFFVPPAWIGFGVAMAASVGAWVQTLVLALTLRRRLGGIDGRRILARIAVYFAAAAIALLAGLGVVAALGGFTDGFAVAGRFASLLSAGVVAGSAALVYLGILALVRVPELAPGIARIRRVLGRG